MSEDRKIKDRHAPFRIMSALLYTSIEADWIESLGDGCIRIDRPSLARHLSTSTTRLKECLQWLDHCGYITLMHSERGRNTLKLRKPERSFS